MFSPPLVESMLQMAVDTAEPVVFTALTELAHAGKCPPRAAVEAALEALPAHALPEAAAAVAELREVAGDRPDLLAETAGILIGASEGRLDEPRSRAAAQLCIAAGADPSLIPGWIEEGRRRAETAKLPPFSRPGRTPPRP